MASIGELLREFITLTSNFNALRSEVDKLGQKSDQNRERIVRLESREDYLMQKMANTAMEGVQRMNFPLVSRIVALEKKCGGGSSGDTPKQIE